MFIDGYNYELTEEQLDVLSLYMDNDLKEDLAYKLTHVAQTNFFKHTLTENLHSKS